MMKKVIIRFIRWYQKIPISWHGYCKFYPTCSDYAIEAIGTYGVFKGTLLSICRIIRCNPFSKGGYDPVKKVYRRK